MFDLSLPSKDLIFYSPSKMKSSEHCVSLLKSYAPENDIKLPVLISSIRNDLPLSNEIDLWAYRVGVIGNFISY